MKKFVVCCLLFVVCCLLFAQTNINEPIASLENTATGGVFENEIDIAFKVHPDFGKYEQQFLYAGWGNPYDQKVADLEGGTGKTRAGYYRPGKMPMSFYGSFSGTRFANTMNWTSGTKSTWSDLTHTTLLSTVKTTYNRILLLGKYDFSMQYLIGIGKEKNIVSGLFFGFEGDNSDFDNANAPSWFSKVKHTDKINSGNSYTESKVNIPAALAPFTNTQLTTPVTSGLLNGTQEKKSTHTFRLGFPLGFKTGSINHAARLELGSSLENRNSRYERKDRTGTTKYRRIHYKSLTNLKAVYGVEIPVKESEEDVWGIGGNVNFLFGNMQDWWKYSAPNGDNGKYSQTAAPGLGFELGLTGSRSFTFPSPKKTVIFKTIPQLDVALYTGMESRNNLFGTHYNQKIKSSGKVGGNTYSYSRVDKSGMWKNHTEFTATLTVPMGLKIMPEGWKIGFLFGATPEIKGTVTTKWDRSGFHRQKTTTTTTINGSSSTILGSGYLNTVGDSSGTSEYSWSWKEEHSFGFTVPFEGGAHLDLMLTGTDITAIKDFKVQAFIPLGTPKARAPKASKKAKEVKETAGAKETKETKKN